MHVHYPIHSLSSLDAVNNKLFLLRIRPVTRGISTNPQNLAISIMPQDMPVYLFDPLSPTNTPQYLFPLQHRAYRQFPRFVYRYNEDTMLIYTDGHARTTAGQEQLQGGALCFGKQTVESSQVG